MHLDADPRLSCMAPNVCVCVCLFIYSEPIENAEAEDKQETILLWKRAKKIQRRTTYSRTMMQFFDGNERLDETPTEYERYTMNMLNKIFQVETEFNIGVNVQNVQPQ